MSILKKLIGVPKQNRTDIFKQSVLDITNNEYECISELYTGSKIKLSFKHITCKQTFEMTPDRFAWGNRCPSCVKKARGERSRKCSKESYKILCDKLGKEYLIPNFEKEYATTHSYLTVTHKTCNNTYKVMARHILYDGSLCPTCSNIMTSTKKGIHVKSRGEVLVSNILDELDIYYEFNKAVKLKEFKGVFDFVVYYDDGSYAAIEYDGVQHFDSKRFKNTSVETIERDKVKDAFCKKNNIPLLRLHYKLTAIQLKNEIKRFFGI